MLVSEYVADDCHGVSFGYVYLGMFGVGAIARAMLNFGGTVGLFAALIGLVLVCTAIALALSMRLHADR